jgi:hypothetical protein
MDEVLKLNPYDFKFYNPQHPTVKETHLTLLLMPFSHLTLMGHFFFLMLQCVLLVPLSVNL